MQVIKAKGRGPASPEEIKAFIAKELAARRRIQKGSQSRSPQKMNPNREF
jgi:hypothetical protein